MVSTCPTIDIVLEKNTLCTFSSASFGRSSKGLGFKVIFELVGDRVDRMWEVIHK